jgi:8-oxo-dGTP pyrophosphatase MutT (NUDIX family)
MGISFRRYAQAFPVEDPATGPEGAGETPDVPALSDPPPCPYCGSRDISETNETGRGNQYICGACGGAQSTSGDNVATPELIGDPSNHPKGDADPDTGGVGGAGNLPQSPKVVYDRPGERRMNSWEAALHAAGREPGSEDCWVCGGSCMDNAGGECEFCDGSGYLTPSEQKAAHCPCGRKVTRMADGGDWLTHDDGSLSHDSGENVPKSDDGHYMDVAEAIRHQGMATWWDPHPDTHYWDEKQNDPHITRGLNLSPGKGFHHEVARRFADGTATADDVLQHVHKPDVGNYWHGHNDSLEDAKVYAHSDHSGHPANFMYEHDEDGNSHVFGELPVVLKGHRPSGWDAALNRPHDDLTGNSHLPANTEVKLHSVHYRDGNENWHELPAEGHTVNTGRGQHGYDYYDHPPGLVHPDFTHFDVSHDRRAREADPTHVDHGLRQKMDADAANPHYREEYLHRPMFTDPEHEEYLDEGLPDDEDKMSEHHGSLDVEAQFHFCATWADVRNKARDITRTGGVHIAVSSGDGIGGEVQGEHNVYETYLAYVPGTKKVGYWHCGCKWGTWAWGRSPAYKRFEGRMCSHALAMQFEAQRQHGFGRKPHAQEQPNRPEWLRPNETRVVVHHQRAGDDTPAVDHARFASATDPEGVYPSGHALDLVNTPLHAVAADLVSRGTDPGQMMRTLLAFGAAHEPAQRLVRQAINNPELLPTDGTSDAREHAEDRGVGVPEPDGELAECQQCHGKGCGACGGVGQVKDGQSTIPDQNADAGMYSRGMDSVTSSLTVMSAAEYNAIVRTGADDDYRMSHRPPGPGDDVGAPLHDLTQTFPSDVYTHPQHYHPGGGDREAQQAMHRARGNPEAPVTIYRAQPKPHSSIRTGDWVSTSGDYARQHAMSNSGEEHDMPVVKATVPAKHIWSPGDDLHEYGYWGPHIENTEVHHPGGKNASLHVADYASHDAFPYSAPEVRNPSTSPEHSNSKNPGSTGPMTGVDPKDWDDAWDHRDDLGGQHYSKKTAGTDMYGDWDGREEDEESEGRTKDWDDIHSGIHEMHRGLAVMLHHDDHAIVHDQNRPLHERASHLLNAIGRGDHNGGLGSHWTTEHNVAEDFADGHGPPKHLAEQAKRHAVENNDHRYGTDENGDPKGQPATSVMLHAHPPDRHAIDEHPDPMAHGSSEMYDYHDHGEREIPIHPGAGVAIKGVSFKPKHSFMDEPDEEPDYEHHEFHETQHHQAAKDAPEPDDEPDPPSHAGVALKAHDTGNVLFLQRAHPHSNPDDPAAGKWEFPGGGLEPGDQTTLHGAIREFEEETGHRFPAGGTVHHTWRSGPYQGHLVVIPEQDALDPRAPRQVENPDGDNEAMAWQNPRYMRNRADTRDEVKHGTPWGKIENARLEKAAGRFSDMFRTTDLSEPAGGTPSPWEHHTPTPASDDAYARGCEVCGSKDIVAYDNHKGHAYCRPHIEEKQASEHPIAEQYPERAASGEPQATRLRPIASRPSQREMMHAGYDDESEYLEDLRHGDLGIKNAELNDQPEPALPVTTGAEDDEDEHNWGPPQNAKGHIPVGGNGASSYGERYRSEMAPEIPSDQVGGQPNQVHASAPSEDVGDIVARFQASAAAKALSGGSGATGGRDGGISDSEIALAAKTALKQFSPSEQAELINEKAASGRARNYGDLNIEGTHYAEIPEDTEELVL